MEFIKVGKNYLIKGGNGRIISEKEKLELENKKLIIEDIKGCGCQGKTTKKISKNKKRIKEIEEADKKLNEVEEVLEETDEVIKEEEHDSIEETD